MSRSRDKQGDYMVDSGYMYTYLAALTSKQVLKAKPKVLHPMAYKPQVST